MRYCAILFLLACQAAAQDCRGGYREGDVMENDPYWYRCSGGRMEAAGCLSDLGQRININEVYDGSTYAWRCTTSPAGHLTIKMDSCIRDGQRVRPGQVMQKDGYWFICEQSGDYLSGKVGGCVVDGRRITIGEKIRKDDNAYVCQLAPGGKAELDSVGCVHKGKEYRIGRTFEDGKFFYSCRTKADKCVVQMLGCVNNGNRLSAYQNYYVQGQMYRCLFSADLKTANHVLEGCVKNDPYTGRPNEKKFGCVWEDGRRPFVYLSQCVNNTGKAVIERIRCKYEGPEGVAEIMPGCWTDLDGLGVGCKADNNGGMEIVTFSAHDESYGHNHGLTHWRDNKYACLVFFKRR